MSPASGAHAPHRHWSLSPPPCHFTPTTHLNLHSPPSRDPKAPPSGPLASHCWHPLGKQDMHGRAAPAAGLGVGGGGAQSREQVWRSQCWIRRHRLWPGHEPQRGASCPPCGHTLHFPPPLGCRQHPLSEGVMVPSSPSPPASRGEGGLLMTVGRDTALSGDGFSREHAPLYAGSTLLARREALPFPPGPLLPILTRRWTPGTGEERGSELGSPVDTSLAISDKSHQLCYLRYFVSRSRQL